MKNKTIFSFVIVLFTVTIVFPGCNKVENSFTDPRDGAIYRTIEIGSQTWIARNLNYMPDSGSWVIWDSPDIAIYGRLYDWETACKVCPDGWHLPSDDEWKNVEEFLGGDKAGGKLKLTGKGHWKSPNTGARNSVSFNALPAGYRGNFGDFFDENSVATISGNFHYLGYGALFWTSTESDSTKAVGRRLHYNYDFIGETTTPKKIGFSVRCVKD